MRTVLFKIKGRLPNDSIIKIDDKIIKFKKNKKSIYSYTHQTESAKVTVSVKKYLELNVKGWFFWQMLLFLATLFGIFDARPEKKCLTVDCQFDFYLKEDNTNVDLKFNKVADGQKAIEVISEANCFEAKNLYTVDKNCKKKLKKLKVAKIITTVVILAASIALIVLITTWFF